MANVYYILKECSQKDSVREGRLYATKKSAQKALDKLAKSNWLNKTYDGKILEAVDCCGTWTCYFIETEKVIQ